MWLTEWVGWCVSGPVCETFTCEAMVGKDVSFKPIFSTDVKVGPHKNRQIDSSS